MTLNSGATLAKSAGMLYLAPLDTGAPDANNLDAPATLEAAGWVSVGWLHEDGPTFSGFEGTNTKLAGWNSTLPVRSITRVTEPQVEVSLLEWNAANLELFFPGASYAAGVLTVPAGGNSDNYEMLIVVHDGDNDLGIWLANASHRGGGSFSFPGDGFSPIPVVFDVLASGEDFVEFLNVDEAEGGS